MKDLYAGIDIGAQTVKIGRLLQKSCKPKGKKVVSCDGNEYDVIDGIKTEDFESTGKRVSEAILNNFGKPAHLFFASFGPFDYKTFEIIGSPNKKEWKGKSYRDWAKTMDVKRFGIENDVNAQIYGEAICGSGFGYKSVAGIAIGTGVGGGIVIDKEIYRGVHDIEPGHMIIYPHGRQCGCGGFGHLEAYISAGALEQRCNYSVKQIPQKLPRLWQEVIENTAIGCANFIAIVNPECFVICGGLAQETGFVEAVSKRCEELLPIFRNTPKSKIVKGALTPYSGVIGAVELSKKL